MKQAMTPSTPAPYPVRLEFDYPDRPLNRWSTAFRLFTALPSLILVALIAGGQNSGLLTVPTAAMIAVRRKYPRWWFDWHLELARFEARAFGYLLLLDDQTPSTEAEQNVHLEFDLPKVEHDLHRWLPLVKWLLAIPHYLVLLPLLVGVIFATVAAWFAILFTGRYPRRLFDYVTGVLRWCTRVQGYAFYLVTDRYPPMRLRS
jgi:hypothetical protein